MKVLLLFLVFISLAPVYGNVIDAPYLPVDFQQNPSDLEWKMIRTENFDIIFPDDIESEAQRVAHLLEKAYPFVTRSLEVNPPRIPLVLQNQSTVSNGFVTLAPRRSEWYVTPAVEPMLTNTEWLKTLSIHEFRHVVQFQKTRRGFNKFLEIILGEIGQGLGLGLTVPPWFLEGDAVGVETALTKGGRGRLPLFDRDLRTLLLSGKEWNYDKAHLGSFKDYVPNHYLYGYFYTSWLRNNYGDLFLSELTNLSAETSWNPLSFYNSTEKLTQQSFEGLYKNVMGDLISEWKKRADELSPTPYTVENLGKRKVWTNYYFPQITEDKKIIALKKGLADIDRFVLIDGKKEKTLFYPGPLQTEHPYKLRNGKLAFFEWEIDPRWGYRDYSRLKIYDIKNDNFILNKARTKGRLAVLDHSGQRVAYVEWDESQGQYIVVANLKGKTLLKMPFNHTEVITSMDWLNDNELVLVLKDRNDMKSISKLDLDNRYVETLLSKSTNNIGFISVSEGQILYESPESGIDNIFLLTGTGPRQITSALFGSYAPVIFQDKLYYNDYTVNGMNIVSKTHPWSEEQKSKDSFYPIYEKFAVSENYEALESELINQVDYPVENYSQPKNSLNLHSWILLAPPLSSTVTAIGYSRDILNNFTLSAGGIYDLNERAMQGFVASTWTHYYPVFDLRAGYGGRRKDVRVGNSEIENKWEEGTLEGGVSVPWTFIQGRFVHNFSIRAFSKLIQVTNKITIDRSEVSDGTLFSPGAELSYGFYSRMARRDINPDWGIFLNARMEEGKDISGKKQKGSIQNVDGKFYLPGITSHHSFYHQLAYERQRDDFYQYSTYVLYPRGTRSTFLQEFYKYSGNYVFPLFYPDWNLSRYFYLKRLSLNLFYDELNGRYRNFSYKAASTGWELLFDINLVRIFVPVTVGVRGSYVLDGIEKENSYEFFLASVIGTF